MLDRIVSIFVGWVILGCIVVMGYSVLHPTFQFSGLDQIVVCIVGWPWFVYQVGYVGPVMLTRY